MPASVFARSCVSLCVPASSACVFACMRMCACASSCAFIYVVCLRESVCVCAFSYTRIRICLHGSMCVVSICIYPFVYLCASVRVSALLASASVCAYALARSGVCTCGICCMFACVYVWRVCLHMSGCARVHLHIFVCSSVCDVSVCAVCAYLCVSLVFVLGVFVL